MNAAESETEEKVDNLFMNGAARRAFYYYADMLYQVILTILTKTHQYCIGQGQMLV